MHKYIENEKFARRMKVERGHITFDLKRASFEVIKTRLKNISYAIDSFHQF